MSTLGEVMRRELFERVARLSAEERVRLTARLARWDLEVYCGASGLDAATGGRALRRQRGTGRRPSGVAEALAE